MKIQICLRLIGTVIGLTGYIWTDTFNVHNVSMIQLTKADFVLIEFISKSNNFFLFNYQLLFFLQTTAQLGLLK